jgi:hypothetical protein
MHTNKPEWKKRTGYHSVVRTRPDFAGSTGHWSTMAYRTEGDDRQFHRCTIIGGS